MCNYCNPCSNSPGPVQGAVKRLTSNFSASCSATGCLLPTLRDAPRFTVAIFLQLRGPSIGTVADQHGPILYLKTMPSSDWECAYRSISKPNTRVNYCESFTRFLTSDL